MRSGCSAVVAMAIRRFCWATVSLGLCACAGNAPVPIVVLTPVPAKEQAAKPDARPSPPVVMPATPPARAVATPPVQTPPKSPKPAKSPVVPAAVAMAAVVPRGWESAKVPGTWQRDVTAPNGRVYRIFLSVPPVVSPFGGFPIVVVLDGNAMFPTLAWRAAMLAQHAEQSGQTPVVVMGIGQAIDDTHDFGARRYDYTPRLGAQRGNEGGADAFLDYLQSDLLPLAAQQAPIDMSRRTLIGHGYGGLLTMHALFTRPKSFDTYVALSPAIWWNDRAIVKELSAFLRAPWDRHTRARVLLGVGGLEQTPVPGMTPAQQSELWQHAAVDSTRRLAASLRDDPQRRVDVTLRVFEGEDQSSAAVLGLLRGFEFAIRQPLGGPIPRRSR